MPVLFDVEGKGLDALENYTLHGRFKVGKPIDEGAYGKIFSCKDLKSGDPLVVKFSEDYSLLATEISNLNKINKVMKTKFTQSKSKHVCELVEYGMMVLDNFKIENGKGVNIVAGYYIMPRYSTALD